MTIQFDEDVVDHSMDMMKTLQHVLKQGMEEVYNTTVSKDNSIAVIYLLFG